MIWFEFSSVIRGHHIYEDILRLLEPDNTHDSFTVAIIENDTLASRVQFLALSFRSSYSVDSSVFYQFVPFPRGQSRCSYGPLFAKWRPAIMESSMG